MHLLKKDLLLEARGKETLIVHGMLWLVTTVISAFGLTKVSASNAVELTVFPLLYWLLFLFVGVFAVSRSVEHDLKGEAVQGLKLAGFDPAAIFISKLVTLCLLIAPVSLCGAVVLLSLLQQPIEQVVSALLLPTLLATPGFVSVAIITSTISLATGLRQLLAPLVTFPLLIPFFLASVGLTVDSLQLASTGSTLEWTPWASLLVGLTVVYTALGINLYGHVISE